MESHQHERINELLKHNFELKKLYQDHLRRDEKIRKYSRRAYLTAREQEELKSLKADKLRGVERMLRMI